NDLKMVTADLSKAPPMKTGINQGYFCIIEGMGAAHTNQHLLTNNYVKSEEIAYTLDSGDLFDNTVGDMDDVLMFTAQAPEGQPFRGLVGSAVRESNAAEVVWFCRGNTLYRRTLLVVPDSEFQNMLNGDPGTTLVMRQGVGLYQRNDVSARINPDTGEVVANSLEDLTLRENRFGHALTWDPVTETRKDYEKWRQQAFPFNIHKSSAAYYLRMPTIQETDDPNWDVSKSFDDNLVNCFSITKDTDNFPELLYKSKIRNLVDTTAAVTKPLPTDNWSSSLLPDSTNSKPFIDYWEDSFPWDDFHSPVIGARYVEDVILTNVISFDIQVWDEDAGRYVNLGEANNVVNGVLCYNDNTPAGPLGGQGKYALSGGSNKIPLPCVYDTWSEEYEREGYEWPDQAGTLTPTRGRDQIDNNYVNGVLTPNGVIDDMGEWTAPPPYDVPLLGVKITIRAFDPRGKNIREMTVIHSFAK
ncbi:MAG: hypothetical protein FWC43_11980, partial [Planctomycetaceae bacterium]|nr:hypothetical protein [Planctomycetaceae bacterium]